MQPSEAPREPYVIDERTDAQSAIFQALGAASMCWLPDTGSAEFDSERAAEIGASLVLHLRHLRSMLESPADDRVAQIRARAEAAHAEVHRLCEGARWTMQVPARPERDSDLVISAALGDIGYLLDQLAEARRQLAEMTKLVDITEESRADLARQNERAERRISHALNYAALLKASSGQRPEVVALDVAWAIRHTLGVQQ